MLYIDAAAVNTADVATKICPGHPNVLFFVLFAGGLGQAGQSKEVSGSARELLRGDQM